MKVVIVVLYLLSAVLPIAGIWRLYGSAEEDAAAVARATPPKSGAGSSIGQLKTALPILIDGIRERPRQVRGDLWLIGAGVAIGAVASIWSLWV